MEDPIINPSVIKKKTKIVFSNSKKEYISLFSLLPYEIWKENLLPLLDIESKSNLSKAHPFCAKMITRACNFGITLNPGYVIYPHQTKALAWMKSREKKNHYGIKGGMLSLTMGLGKTLIAILSVLFNKADIIRNDKNAIVFPALIVCSKTLLTHWKLDIEKFFGDRLRVLYFHKKFIGDQIEEIDREDLMKYDLVITTYNLVLDTFKKREYEKRVIDYDENQRIVGVHKTKLYDRPKIKGPAVIFNTPWYKAIVDESHKFANYKTNIYKAMMGIWANYYWCLTGTPLRNKETDIFHQLRFCGYIGCDRDNEWDANKMNEHSLHKVILKMSYKDAGIVLPNKIVKDIELVFNTEEEAKAYDEISGRTKNTYKDMMLGSVNYASVLAMFTRLRQACIAPYIITREAKRKGKNKKKTQEEIELEKQLDITTQGLESWIHNKNGSSGKKSSKMEEMIKIIKAIPEDEKIVIFSKFTSALDVAAETLKEYMPSFKFFMIDGDTDENERERYITKFKVNKKVRGMLASYDVASEGLNFTEANHVICLEQWWCPYVHFQAESRCWRFGQTKDVYIYRIFMRDTIEVNMVKMIYQNKEKLNDELIETVNIEKLDKYKLGRIISVW